MRMDLSKFKYVSSDKKSTTLKHPRGHQITVLHSMLTPEHREMFEAMAKGKDEATTVKPPVKYKKMADGGEVPINDLDKEPSDENEVPNNEEDMPDQPRKKMAGGGPIDDIAEPDPKKTKAFVNSLDPPLGDQMKQDWQNLKKGLGIGTSQPEQKAKGGAIKRMADGGDTSDGANSGDAQPNAAGSTININLGGQGAAGAQGPTGPANAPVAVEAPQAQPEAPTKPFQWSDLGNVARQAILGPDQPEVPVEGAPAVPAQGAPGVVAPPAPQDANGAQGSNLPYDASLDPRNAPTQAQDDAANRPDPWTQASQTALSGIGMQQAGQKQQYQAERDLAERQQDTLSGQQDMMRRMSSDFQAKAQDVDQASQHFMQAFQQQNIDPKHYVNNMSTGDKIATAIGLIAGGLGAAYNGGHNYAQDFLNKQIDNDIEAQKANLGKSATLLEANFKRFGNLRDATQMTKAMNLDLVSSMLQRDAAMSGDQMAKARMLDASGKLQQQKSEIQRNVALNQMLMDASKSNHADDYLKVLRVAAPDKAKEIEGRYVPGVGIASVPVPEKSREELGLRQQLADATQNLRKWASTRSGDLSPTDRNYGQALASSVQDLYRRANGQGVFREAEADFVKGIVADNPTAFFNKIRVLPKYKALEDSNRAALNGVKRQYGLPTQANINFTPKGQ